MSGVVVVRVIAVGLLTALIVGSCWAETHGDLWPALAAQARDPWGAVTFTDLGSGLTMMALWISWREPRRMTIPLWIVGLLFFGNMVSLLFVVRCSLGAASIGDIVRGHRAQA